MPAPLVLFTPPLPARPSMLSDLDPPHDVLCVGLVCVDLLLEVPHHPGTDEKLRASSRLVAPGGPAAVAAAQASRLGGRAAFAGLIGDDAVDPFAALLRRAFAAENIDTSALQATPAFETPLAAILVKPDATRAVVSHRPPSPDCATHMVTQPGETRSSPAPALPSARVILTDGHRPEWNDALLAHARAFVSPLVLDAGSWSESVRALAPRADHLVASEACARAALGGADPAETAPVTLRLAFGAHPDAIVVVTLGPRGLVWSTPDQAGKLPSFRIEALDTTGAGDAFHGAYSLGLARGLPLPRIFRLASAAGALACTRPGAWPALARADEVDALLALPC